MAEFESIQPERSQAYLRNAAEVVNEGSEAIINELGTKAIQEATAIAADDSQAPKLVEDISDYKDKNDISVQWSKSLDVPIDTGIADAAEMFLQRQSRSYEASPFNMPTQQTESDRAETLNQIDEMLAMGNDNEIYGLTIDKDAAYQRVNADGVLEYQSASGRWVSEADVDSAHIRWQDNPTAIQKANWFVTNKTVTPGPE